MSQLIKDLAALRIRLSSRIKEASHLFGMVAGQSSLITLDKLSQFVGDKVSRKALQSLFVDYCQEPQQGLTYQEFKKAFFQCQQKQNKEDPQKLLQQLLAAQCTFSEAVRKGDIKEKDLPQENRYLIKGRAKASPQILLEDSIQLEEDMIPLTHEHLRAEPESIPTQELKSKLLKELQQEGNEVKKNMLQDLTNQAQKRVNALLTQFQNSLYRITQNALKTQNSKSQSPSNYKEFAKTSQPFFQRNPQQPKASFYNNKQNVQNVHKSTNNSYQRLYKGRFQSAYMKEKQKILAQYQQSTRSKRTSLGSVYGRWF